MRASQKAARRTHCDLLIDIPSNLLQCPAKGFSKIISSAAVEHELQTQLHLLFSLSAPTVEPICADAARRSIGVWVGGGRAGIEMLRAACAIVTSLQPIDGGENIPMRISVARILR